MSEPELDDTIKLFNDIQNYTSKLKLLGILIELYPTLEYSNNQCAIIPELRTIETFDKAFTLDCGRINKGNIIVNRQLMQKIEKSHLIKIDVRNLNIEYLGTTTENVLSVCYMIDSGSLNIIYDVKTIDRITYYIEHQVNLRKDRMYQYGWFSTYTSNISSLLRAKETLLSNDNVTILGKTHRDLYRIFYNILMFKKYDIPDEFNDQFNSLIYGLVKLLKMEMIEPDIENNSIKYTNDFEDLVHELLNDTQVILNKLEKQKK
jgi:hypothetical protein